MHKWARSLVVCGLALFPSALLAQPSGYLASSGEPLPLQVVVDFEDGVDADDLAALSEAAGAQVRYNSEFSEDGEDIAKISVSSPSAMQRLMEYFKGRDDVESVEQNYTFHALWTPNDPLYKSQWHMDMIRMQAAWGQARGRGVVVAVIDTGVSDGSGQLKQVEDLTDARFVPGYDFVNDRPAADDDHAHGTHVAGTIAQATDNEKGVAGVAFEASIMPIKVLNRNGSGYVSDIAEGIMWAADHGADVINMSLGGPFPSAVMYKAVRYAHAKGVIVVCAAGNSGRKGVGYPAAFKKAVAVSAIGPDRKLAHYSSWGKQLDLAAPGGDTRVDLNNDGIPDGVLQNTITPMDPGRQGYFAFQGTSMASPHVAGAAALVISTGVTDPDKVEDILEASAADMGDADHFGAGLLDVDAAVSRAIWRRGLLRGLLAILLAALAVWHARLGRGLESGAVGIGFVLGLVPAATGLFFLNSLEVSQPWLFFVTRPV
ncbi:MAG: S8 family peptidase, partial [Planctomycetota bacterium]